MTIMGRRCTIKKDDGSIECVFPSDKHSADGNCILHPVMDLEDDVHFKKILRILIVGWTMILR